MGHKATSDADLHEEQPKEQNIAKYCEDIAPWATGRGMQAPA